MTSWVNGRTAGWAGGQRGRRAAGQAGSGAGGQATLADNWVTAFNSVIEPMYISKGKGSNVHITLGLKS